MKRLAVGLLALVILIGCAAVYAADTGTGESLVTQGYLNDTYIPDVLRQAETRIAEQTKTVYDSVLADLNARHSGYLARAGGEQSYAASITDFRFKRGDVVSLPAGSGLLLLAGSGTVSYSGGSVVDITVGQTVASGTALTARHRVLAAENTTAAVTITSDTAVLGVEGFYTVSSGAGLDYNALADALKQMGLFQGTGTAYGSGYDLEQAPTRIVGLVMFLRLIGEEGAALSSTAANPFADTPAWCDRYVAYAYEKGYTKGNNISAGGQRYFGPDAQLSAGEYMTFLLRALGYSDSGASPDFSWANAVGKSVEFAQRCGTGQADRQPLPAGPGGLSVLFRTVGPSEGRQRHPAGQDGCQQRRGQSRISGGDERRHRGQAELNGKTLRFTGGSFCKCCPLTTVSKITKINSVK